MHNNFFMQCLSGWLTYHQSKACTEAVQSAISQTAANTALAKPQLLCPVQTCLASSSYTVRPLRKGLSDATSGPEPR